MPSFRNHSAAGLKRPKQENSLLPKCQVCVGISKETFIGYKQVKACYELNKVNSKVCTGSVFSFGITKRLSFIRFMPLLINEAQSNPST